VLYIRKTTEFALIEQFPFLDMRVSSDLCIDYSFTCPLKKKNLYTPFILSKLIQIIPSDLKRKKNHKKQKKKKKIVPKLSIPRVLPHHHKCVYVFFIFNLSPLFLPGEFPMCHVFEKFRFGSMFPHVQFPFYKLLLHKRLLLLLLLYPRF
jgi:hypothetical protein